MVDADLNQPVVVTYRSETPHEPIRFESLRKALHTIILDFDPEKLSTAFICTKQGGLNIVEIRALYSSLCKAYADDFASTNDALPRNWRSPIDA